MFLFFFFFFILFFVLIYTYVLCVSIVVSYVIDDYDVMFVRHVIFLNSIFEGWFSLFLYLIVDHFYVLL